MMSKAQLPADLFVQCATRVIRSRCVIATVQLADSDRSRRAGWLLQAPAHEIRHVE
jgi:hypothetical protein